MDHHALEPVPYVLDARIPQVLEDIGELYKDMEDLFFTQFLDLLASKCDEVE